MLLSEHEVFDRYTQVQFNRSRRHKNLDPEAAALKKKRKQEKYGRWASRETFNSTTL